MQTGDTEIVLGVDCEGHFCPLVQRSVPIAPGENRVQFTIPTLHELRVVRTRNDVGTIGVRFIQDSPLSSYRLARFESDETRIERLLPGSYELTGHSNGKGWKKTVRVPEQSSVRVP